MKLNTLIRRLLLSLSVIWGGQLLSSCVEEAIAPEEGFSLYYPAISEIAPSTNINITPTWRGGQPSGFAISSVTSEGNAVDTECFSVDPDKGVFSITTSDNLPTGVYQIGISCNVKGKTYDFPKAIEVEMMKPVPDGIVVEPALISTKLIDVLAPTKDTQLPTALITSDGSNHVKIKEILIANVYLDGKLYNEAKDWFEISESGEFSILPENEEFEAGIYTFDLKITTYIVGKDSEKGIFKNALTLNVTSAPTKLTYIPSALKVEFNVAGKSVAPAFKGSREGLTYKVKSVSPNNDIGITVDPSTGEIMFPKTDKTQIGDSYTVSLSVSNDFGSADFNDVFTFTVIEFLDPITQFSYNNIDENISGVSFNNEVAVMDGAEVSYSFVNLPEALSKLTLDKLTGTVSNPVGSELPVGDYTVTVRAENAKGHMDASFSLKVVANPNYFTYVCWGNNLGPDGTALTPLRKYGSQFRLYSGSSTLKVDVVESDIPEGRPVTFTKERPSTANGGVDVTAKGQVQVYPRNATQNTVLSYITVAVTVGEGEAAITRRFPVFADLYTKEKGSAASGTGLYHVMYTPFAVRVNPKTGGISEAPTITDGDGNDVKDQIALDFYTNAMYYNLNGPASHTDPTMLKNDSNRTTFLANIWQRYLDAMNKSWNAYSVEPMSYWKNYQNATLDMTGGYVDPTDDYRIHVNPEKFMDKEGNYADGVMYMTMAFSKTGIDPAGDANRLQMNRVFLWFDPNYTE